MLNVHEHLTEAAQALKEYEKLLRRRDSVNNLLIKERKRRGKLAKTLSSEGRDLERLDGVNLLNLWHSIRGTKDEAKQKEETEYLSAKLKYDETNDSVETLEAELSELEKKIAASADSEENYRQALLAKESYLLRTPGPTAKLLLELDEKMGFLNAEFKEIEEAVEAGQKASKSLAKVENSLSSAQGWGTLDIVGGGLLVTAVKHTHINDAQREIKQAQEMLARFQRELNDVKMEHTIDIGRVSTAADFLLDGLVFDLIVQSQINTAKSRTAHAKTKLQTAIKDLNKMLEKNRNKYQETKATRTQIIENEPIVKE